MSQRPFDRLEKDDSVPAISEGGVIINQRGSALQRFCDRIDAICGVGAHGIE